LFARPGRVCGAQYPTSSPPDLIRWSIVTRRLRRVIRKSDQPSLPHGLPGHRRNEVTPFFERLCPAMTEERTERRNKRREAERRQTLAPTCRAAGTAAAPLHILPRMRGRIKEGAARLSAFHRGSDGRAFARGARLQARLPGTR
jgi:hypothetical protein